MSELTKVEDVDDTRLDEFTLIDCDDPRCRGRTSGMEVRLSLGGHEILDLSVDPRILRLRTSSARINPATPP